MVVRCHVVTTVISSRMNARAYIPAPTKEGFGPPRGHAPIVGRCGDTTPNGTLAN
jgi:hypothetical protein